MHESGVRLGQVHHEVEKPLSEHGTLPSFRAAPKRRKLGTMEDDQTPSPEKPAATDWADLRAQAAKLGISLSELQQQQRERKARLARKFSYKPPVEKAKE